QAACGGACPPARPSPAPARKHCRPGTGTQMSPGYPNLTRRAITVEPSLCGPGRCLTPGFWFLGDSLRTRFRLLAVRSLFDTMVRLLAPCLSRASMGIRGMPARPKPPTAMLAPSEMPATASAAVGATLPMGSAHLPAHGFRCEVAEQRLGDDLRLLVIGQV